MELAVVPIFQSEITPKQARGFIVGTYQISLFVRRSSVFVLSYRNTFRANFEQVWWIGYEYHRERNAVYHN
jgi:MFS transporter, SP family, sugar:H+ symporter